MTRICFLEDFPRSSVTAAVYVCFPLFTALPLTGYSYLFCQLAGGCLLSVFALDLTALNKCLK